MRRLRRASWGYARVEGCRGRRGDRDGKVEKKDWGLKRLSYGIKLTDRELPLPPFLLILEG